MRDDTFYRSNNLTGPMEFYLHDCKTFDDFEKKFSDEFLDEDNRIGFYLVELLDKYDKKASRVSEDAGCHASYVGNMINGRRSMPSRDVLIRICFAIGTTAEEVQYLLKYAGYSPLYVRNKRDVIIWFGFMKAEGIDIVNENLYHRGFPTL